MARFEDRLWSELVEQHGAVLSEQPVLVSSPPRRLRRAPIAAAGLALAVALAALVLALGRGGGASAYAVVANPDGTVTVTINELIGVEPANVRLEQLGVPARIPPVQSDCPTSRSDLKPARLSPERSRESFEPVGRSGSYGVRIDPKAIPAGDTLVLRAYEPNPGVVVMRALLIEGPAPSCLTPDPGQPTTPTAG